MTNDVRVSISEAARLFGVSAKTIRQAIKDEEIIYIVVNGRYKLNFKSLIDWSQRSTRRRNLLAKAGIGQYVDKWNIKNKKYSPRAPKKLTKGEPNESIITTELTYEKTDDEDIKI